jgi:hypothetical protein
MNIIIDIPYGRLMNNLNTYIYYIGTSQIIMNETEIC